MISSNNNYLPLIKVLLSFSILTKEQQNEFILKLIQEGINEKK